MKFSLRSLFAIVTLVAIAIGCVLAFGRLLEDETVLARLPLPDSSELRITTDNFHEAAAAIYWQRMVDGEPQHHRSAIGYCHPPNAYDAKFATATSIDNDLIVVFERQNPDVVLAFIEHSTATQYPNNGEPPWDAYYQKMDQVIQKLRYENPDRTFILSAQVPFNRDLLVR